MRAVKAKQITNGAKVFSVILALVLNVVQLIVSGSLPDYETQKSIILLCSFIFIPFSFIDLSLLVKNIFKAPGHSGVVGSVEGGE